MPSGSRTAGPAVTYRSVFAIGEFRGMWTAQVLSGAGNQLGQVAIAVLAYERTGSPWLTGLIYSMTLLPSIFGGPLLSVLADMFPRRTVMLCCDLARAALVAVMTIPSAPYWALCALLVCVVLLRSPFSSARIALLPEVLPHDALALGQGAGNIAFQVNQVAGFALGGTLVAIWGPSLALAADAATFLASAAIVARSVRRRPAPAGAGTGRSLVRWVREGCSLALGRPVPRAVVLISWLAAFYVLPEGIAVPYAHALGGGPGTAGLLMAAMPAGIVVGGTVLTRFCTPALQDSLIGWLAIVSCAPLVFTAFRPPLPVVLTLWVISGLGTAYQLPAFARFILRTPASGRASAFGIAQSALLSAQGIGILAGGAMAQALGPEPTVAIAGLAGLAAASGLAVLWHRAITADPSS